jgi:malonate transporter and related proteins
MIEILNVALPFFGLILLGVLAGKIWNKGEEGLAWLNIYVLYFALPPLIFMVVAQTPLDKLANPTYVLATAGATSACFLLMLLVARKLFHASIREAALQGTAAAYGNVGYMGLPLSVAFFGQSAAVPAALVFSFDCAVLFVLTAVFAGLEDKRKNTAQLIGKILKDVFTHPFNLATIAGVIASASKWQPEGGLLSIVEMLMRSAAPVALFAMGVTVSLRGSPALNVQLGTLGFIKIVLHPLLAFAAVYLFVSADTAWLQVAVMMAALPTATNAFILARQYNAYVAGAGAAVIATTAVSVVTIPLIVYALKHWIS